MTFDPGRVSAQDLLAAIRELGYEPEVVTAPCPSAAAAERLDPAALAGDLRAAFAEARGRGVPLLVEFSGPG